MVRSSIGEFEQAHEWLSRLSYKPTFKFHLRRAICTDHIELRITHLVDDVQNPDRQKIHVSACHIVPVGTLQSFDEFKAWIRSLIMTLEIHELDEWLKFDGIQMNDPHAMDAL